MPFARRSITLACFCLAMAGYWYGPRLLALEREGLEMWALVGQMGGPLAAAICCFVAVRRSEGSDRSAWISFGSGSALYVIGNLFYVYYNLAGAVPVFPTTPEAAYFLMAIFFAVGMFQFGRIRGRASGLDVYNFLLIYCAVTLASLLVLNHNIAASVLAPFPTAVAFLYPTIWFGVAASGVISLLLYDQGEKSFPFALLIVAVLAEAVADLFYALTQMEGGSYQLGGVTQLLWVGSAALMTWAAAEQIIASRPLMSPSSEEVRDSSRGVAQAVVPAAAVAVILMAASMSGALGGGRYVWLSAALAFAFSVVAGLREHWIVYTQRRLRAAVELAGTALAGSQARLTAVLESTSDSVIVLDREWRIEFFNQRAFEVSEPLGRLSLGSSFWDVFPMAYEANRGQRYRRAMETQQPVEFEEYIEGTGIWLELHAYPTPDGLSIFFRDISDRRRIREEMMHMAHHDPLTGLANRTLFRDRLRRAVGSNRDSATFLLDLDHFKEVNDTLGHPVGDVLLVETAERLGRCLRSTDTIARLGGDEFAIILEDHAGTGEVTLVAQRIIDAVNAPYLVDGQAVRVGASIGIALSEGRGDDPDRVFKNADVALYAAKAEARGAYRFFDPAMMVGIKQRQTLRADLRVALENGEFEVAYQPIVDLRAERICSFEALLRWRHPTQGIVPSDIFIPIAEETGLIIAIGDWVLKTACLDAVDWPAGISVAVNLSTHQFTGDDLADKIKATLDQTGLESSRLELEITESVLLKDSNTNMLTLRRLQELGIRIALDDFGTGYSSLGYLQKFPFSKLKIDQSFIRGLPGNVESQAIVRSVIGLGQSLGMRVTAEGVETEAQLDWVKIGCDEAQGYLLGRPGPAADIAGFLVGFARSPLARRAQFRRVAS